MARNIEERTLNLNLAVSAGWYEPTRRVRALVGLTSLLVFATGTARSQTPAKPEFEVASVRPSGFAYDMTGGPGTTDPERIHYAGVTIEQVLPGAYEVKYFQIISLPDWAKTERYEIVAVVPPGTTVEQFRLMLQNLLSDRFQLKVHRETRELPVYELTISKKGLKLKATAPDALDGPQGVIPGRLMSPKISTSQLALELTNLAGRPIIDKTGLTGDYNVKIEWAADNKPDDPGPSLFTAFEDQLGLKLEPSKAMV